MTKKIHIDDIVMELIERKVSDAIVYLESLIEMHGNEIELLLDAGYNNITGEIVRDENQEEIDARLTKERLKKEHDLESLRKKNCDKSKKLHNQYLKLKKIFDPDPIEPSQPPSSIPNIPVDPEPLQKSDRPPLKHS